MFDFRASTEAHAQQSWESLSRGFTLIAAFCLFSALMTHKRCANRACKCTENMTKVSRNEEFKCWRTEGAWGQERLKGKGKYWRAARLQSEGICSICRRQSRTHQHAVSPVISSTLNSPQRLHMKADRKRCHGPSDFNTSTEFWFLHFYLTFWVKDKISVSAGARLGLLEFGQDETSQEPRHPDTPGCCTGAWLDWSNTEHTANRSARSRLIKNQSIPEDFSIYLI